MRTKAFFLFGYFLLYTAISFAEAQKSISGQVVSIDSKEPVPLAVITYSNDCLMQEKNPYLVKTTQTSSDIDGRFFLHLPDENCGHSFLVTEIMGYEPVFINLDTLTINEIIINLQSKTYDLSVMYSSDTVYWKCNNLKKYSYVFTYPATDNDIVGVSYDKYDTKIHTNATGEWMFFPEPKIGFDNWLKSFILKGNISDSTVVEITINRNPIEVNYFSGKINDKGFDFIKNEKWEVPRFFLSEAWMRISKYNPPRRVRITFVEMK